MRLLLLVFLLLPVKRRWEVVVVEHVWIELGIVSIVLGCVGLSFKNKRKILRSQAFLCRRLPWSYSLR